MGCDIHGSVEIFHQGEWKRVMDIGDISPRNYALFAELFGVRGYSSLESNYGGRGFPADVALGTKYAFCMHCEGEGRKDCGGPCADWHSTSYITIQEIERHQELITRCIGKDVWAQEWHVVFDSMRFWSEYLKEQVVIVESRATLSTGKEDTSRVRLIVWFDN